MKRYESSSLTEKVSNKATKGAKAADEAVRKFPYRAIGVALGMGALTGFFAARHSFTKGEYQG